MTYAKKSSQLSKSVCIIWISVAIICRSSSRFNIPLKVLIASRSFNRLSNLTPSLPHESSRVANNTSANYFLFALPRERIRSAAGHPISLIHYVEFL